MKKRILLIFGLIACLMFAFCGCGETQQTAVELDRDTLSLFVGAEEQLIVRNAGDKEIVWASSDKKVVTVEADGTGAFVKGIAAGAATVTA